SKVLLCDFHRENAWVDGAGRKIMESQSLQRQREGVVFNKWLPEAKTTSLPAKTQESLPRRLFKRELLQDITTLQLTRLDVADKNNRLHPQDIGVGAESILKSTTGVELTVLEFRRDCMQG
ncbi:hypothetical protein KUCAC02_037710, partial [Chaenocephalus aceratus]